jgi:hypothetical protein
LGIDRAVRTSATIKKITPAEQLSRNFMKKFMQLADCFVGDIRDGSAKRHFFTGRIAEKAYGNPMKHVMEVPWHETPFADELVNS